MMNRSRWRNILFKRRRLFLRACRRGLIAFAERLLFCLEERAVIVRPARTPSFPEAGRDTRSGKPCGGYGKNKRTEKTDSERAWVLSGYTDNLICCDFRAGNEDTVEGISRRIDAFVQEKKLFLDPDLTLEKLARELGSNRTYLSRALTRCKGEHFNHYVNSFRLRYGAQVLEDDGGLDALDVALLSGFKNERTFLRALKECSGEEVLYLKKRYICKNR